MILYAMPVTHRHRAATALLLVPFALAACAHSGTTSAPPRQVAVSPSPSAEPTEGPSGTAHRYPDGLTVRITRLERLDTSLASGLKPGEVLVKVTAVLTNDGTRPVPLNPSTRPWTVLSGPNRLEASQEAGWSDSADRLRSKQPQQVAPGQTVTVFDTADVPADQIGVLAVQMEVAAPRWVFTDAQSLLR